MHTESIPSTVPLRAVTLNVARALLTDQLAFAAVAEQMRNDLLTDQYDGVMVVVMPENEITVETLQAALRKCRSWVQLFSVGHQQEAEDQEDLLQLINQLAPPVPVPVPEQCEKDPACAYGKGHDGGCDELPF
jgi:hypothetical protein